MTSTGSLGETGWAEQTRPFYGTPLPIGGSLGSVGAVNVNIGPPPPANELGPDIFYKNFNAGDDPATQLNQKPPRAWTEGGVIENVKTAVVAGIRGSLQRSSMQLGFQDDMKFSVSIEYPTKETEYPGVWVQFLLTNLARAGLGMDTNIKDDDGNWIQIRQWMFDGRIVLTIAALSSKERDRLADAVIAQLAFSRSEDLAIRNPAEDTKQMRGLWQSINDNPYIAMSLGTDKIQAGGQTVSSGVPWAPDVLLYEDSYSIDCNGQFNIAFRHDGVYELAQINVNVQPMTDNVGFTNSLRLQSPRAGMAGLNRPPPSGTGGVIV